MIITNIASSAKVWVYQSSTVFTPEQLLHIKAKLSVFVGQWSSHGDKVHGSFDIVDNRFLVIIADESEVMVTGCSIDSSVRVMKELEKEIEVQLLDKSLVAFQNEGEQVFLVNIAAIPAAVNAGQITLDTLVYNNAISNYADYTANWKVKAHDSWVKRYFS